MVFKAVKSHESALYKVKSMNENLAATGDEVRRTAFEYGGLFHIVMTINCKGPLLARDGGGEAGGNGQDNAMAVTPMADRP